MRPDPVMTPAAPPRGVRRQTPLPTKLAVSLVVLIAALHALAMATARPMFQISDEVAYFSGVQIAALERVPIDELGERRRVAPPDGTPVDPYVSGKPVFRRLLGDVYLRLIKVVTPATAAVLLRLLLALSLPACVVLTFLLARDVAPSNPMVTIGAPLLVALHPVFAAYAAAISPDGLANTVSMLVFWLLVRFGSGRGYMWEPVVMVAASVAAFLLKDTALFLFVAVLCGVVARAGAMRARWGSWRGVWRRDVWSAAATLITAASPLLLVTGRVRAAVFDSTNFAEFSTQVREGTIGATSGWGRLWAVFQPSSLFRSFWGDLANFGGNQVLLPDGVLGVIALACVISGVGLGAITAARPEAHESQEAVRTRKSTLLLLACGLPLVVQTCARDWVLGIGGALQGRWLFPMMGPLMVLLCLGWSQFPRGRQQAVPFLGFAAATLAAVSLVGILIPAFYESFSAVYRNEHLFLLGPFGRPVEPSRLMLFFERPEWLRSGLWGSGPVLAFIVAAFVWPVGYYRYLQRHNWHG